MVLQSEEWPQRPAMRGNPSARRLLLYEANGEAGRHCTNMQPRAVPDCASALFKKALHGASLVDLNQLIPEMIELLRSRF